MARRRIGQSIIFLHDATATASAAFGSAARLRCMFLHLFPVVRCCDTNHVPAIDGSGGNAVQQHRADSQIRDGAIQDGKTLATHREPLGLAPFILADHFE